MKLVAQEDSMGCGVACVASVLEISYKDSMKLFDEKRSSTKGYYLKDLLQALNKKGVIYKSGKVTDKTRKYVNKVGSIVFVKRSKKFPVGHYLLKTSKGWMNPWINSVKITHAKADFQQKLPGTAQWIVYQP